MLHMQYQRVTQGALKRFQYTGADWLLLTGYDCYCLDSGLIMNNPTDLCIPTLGTFLDRCPIYYNFIAYYNP